MQAVLCWAGARLRRLVPLLLAFGLVASGALAAATPAYAVGSYNNADIADLALSHLNENPAPGGGQCKPFANNMVKAASSNTQNPSGYQDGWAALGTEVSSADAVKGDIVQITPAGSNDSTAESIYFAHLDQYGNAPAAYRLHTAIVVQNNGSNSFTVVDANFTASNTVGEHTFNPYAWAAGSLIHIWRLGTVVVSPPQLRHVPGDFNGDGRSDLVVYRPSEGNWYVQSPGIYSAVTQWGLPGDIPVAADYNGDGKTDYAVYRPSNQTWYLNSPGVYSQVTQFGWPGDIPVPGDFNGDGHADIAIYRPSDQTWHINGVGTWQWGLPGDIPTVADFNGDGRDDMAVYRPSEGNWYILSPGVYSQVVAFGWPGDVPEQGCYGGGNAATQAVFRPSTQEWHANGVGTWQWGLPGDTPITGDFNGDLKTDLAVYRPSEGNWYVQGPGVYIQITPWGFPTDVPAVQTLPAPLLVQYGLISSY